MILEPPHTGITGLEKVLFGGYTGSCKHMYKQCFDFKNDNDTSKIIN